MNNLLIGNGILIQFSGFDYTNKSIVLRTLENFEKEDFPSHLTGYTPFELKAYFAVMFKQLQAILNSEYDDMCTCSAEFEALQLVIDKYSGCPSLQISDIGFEDYYLISDLICHKMNIVNPKQFQIRESLRASFLHSIYNNGALNEVYKKFPTVFINMLKSYDYIFTTNYDNNIEMATSKEVFHIHGSFCERNDIYKPDSFRNQLGDHPFENYIIDEKYFYIYSTAISAHCGNYKNTYMHEGGIGNSKFEEMASAYEIDPDIRADIDSWKDNDNPLVARLYDAIQFKLHHPDIKISEPYHTKEFENMNGHLDIIGLSPYNDFHIFESINNSPLEDVTYYYFDENECDLIKKKISSKSINYKPVKELWKELI